MEKAVKPLSRQELQKLLVTDADAFTAFRFLRHREHIPALADLEAIGEESLPGTAGALCDLYHALWADTPVVRDEVAPDRRFFGEILKAAMASTAYGELHAQTHLSDLKSVLGTVTMGESVIAQVSEEDKKKLKESAQAQEDADKAEAEAEQAEAEAEAAQSLADMAVHAAKGESDDEGIPGQTGTPSAIANALGGGMSATQAQKRADEIAEMAAKAQAKAAKARADADAAKELAEQAANELFGEPGSEDAAKKLQELSAIGKRAVEKARAEVKEVSETLEGWGLDESELVRESIPEALGVLERMKKSQAFRHFQKLLGRIKRIAARKARSKDTAEGVRVTCTETGRDIKRAVPRERVALMHHATRAKALVRWAHGELTLRGEQTKRKLGHGPVIVCEDGSGSMDGAKRWWAKSVVLGLAYYAKLQKRSFAWVHFGGRYDKLAVKVFKGGRMSAKDVLEIAETFFDASGTDFEVPLKEALRIIREEGLSKADLCFVTDGECAVTTAFLVEFLGTVRSLDVNVFTVLCDVGSTSDATVKSFSRVVEQASSFDPETAEKTVFGNL